MHDFSIMEALQAYIVDKKIIGVMGGHATSRKDPEYLAYVFLGDINIIIRD